MGNALACESIGSGVSGAAIMAARGGAEEPDALVRVISRVPGMAQCEVACASPASCTGLVMLGPIIMCACGPTGESDADAERCGVPRASIMPAMAYGPPAPARARALLAPAPEPPPRPGKTGMRLSKLKPEKRRLGLGSIVSSVAASGSAGTDGAPLGTMCVPAPPPPVLRPLPRRAPDAVGEDEPRLPLRSRALPAAELPGLEALTTAAVAAGAVEALRRLPLLGAPCRVGVLALRGLDPPSCSRTALASAAVSAALDLRRSDLSAFMIG